jgi:hypothetical protein
MLKKGYFLVFITMIVFSHAFAVPQQERSYKLINLSNENIIIKFKTKDFLKNISYYEFFNDDVNIGRIDSHSNYKLYNEIDNQIIPFKNSYVNGEFSWKYIDLIVIKRVLYFEYEKDQDGNIIFQTINEQAYPRRKNVRFCELTGKEIFDIFVEEFIIYDMFGNIIMTIDDITEEIFSTNYVEDYIEIFTEDFYNTPFYKYIGNNNDREFKPYGIFVTTEQINGGRTKYRN